MKQFQRGDVVVTPLGRVGTVQRIELLDIERAHIKYEDGEKVALPTDMLKISERAPRQPVVLPPRALPAELDPEEARRIGWCLDLRAGFIR